LNSADYYYSRGGAIFSYFYATTILNNSSISSNVSNYAGGIYNGDRSKLFLNNSSVSNNSNNGIINSLFGSVTVSNTTISSNSSSNRAGGGLLNYGVLYLSNSTISGNTTEGDRGEGYNLEGGIANFERATITNSTIIGNLASKGGGGGIANGGFGILTLHRTLISGNKALTGIEVLHASNYPATYSRVDSNNFNLFGTNGNPGVEGFTPGPNDIVPNVPLKKILGPLKNNGGPTFTQSLVKGSPAIDAAPMDANCPATDQRGVARPQGTGCDIGAVEYTGGGTGSRKSR
jgi:hypothetical protein